MKNMIGLMILLALPLVHSANCDKGYSFDTGVIPSPLPSNWMSQLFDDTPLSQLSLPGTHDTMAYKGQAILFNTISQTHKKTLADQLTSGIRVLDIRCKRVNNLFLIYHGAVNLQSTFYDVLNTVTAFLAANPSETILMRIKEEDSPTNSNKSFTEVFLTYYNNATYSNYFWTYNSNNNPLLKNIRGKMVVLQDWTSLTAYGIPYNRALDIQDTYAMANSCSLGNTKWPAIVSKLNDASSGSWSNIYMNYLSASGGSNTSYPYFYASGKGSNPTCANRLICNCATCSADFWLASGKRYYKGTNMLFHDWSGWSTQPRRVGLIMADFPDGNLTRRIYDQNSIILTSTPYEIRPGHVSGLSKCLALPGGDTSAGVRLEQTDCSGIAKQKFTFNRNALDNGQQFVKIKTSAGLCLEVEGGSVANGARIWTATCSASDSQRFIAEPRDGGFRFRNINSDKCIDVDQESSSNGAAIHQYDCGEAYRNEIFKLRK